jgi:ATP-dependent Clp protease ATP-binding subunit ClpA
VSEKYRINEGSRWWSRDKLGRIPGLGKNWAYGNIFYLEEYCHELPFVEPEYASHAVYGTKELSELEAILVRNRGANVFLVGNDKEEQINILARLNRLIEDGAALPELEHLRIAYFDNELFTSTLHTKAEFETKLLQLMNEANYAGNIILVFADFPALIESANALGTDISSLLERYFTSSNLHMVGLADTERYHVMIEPNVALRQRFESILMEANR